MNFLCWRIAVVHIDGGCMYLLIMCYWSYVVPFTQIYGGVWLGCLRWAFVFRGRRGTCFNSVCAKPGGLACRGLKHCFIHTSDVLPLSFAHMSHSHSFRDVRQSSWNPHFERRAISEQQVCAVFQLGVWASPLMFHATRSNRPVPCQLYLANFPHKRKFKMNVWTVIKWAWWVTKLVSV